MVPIGEILAGRYRVDRILGQGGMGVVVQAMHLQLHQPVAVKFLLPDAPRKSELVQRLLREAQAVASLRSEHVRRVLDVGALDDGTPYMVLEYLDGADLAHEARGQLTVGQIADLMVQACEALAEAHSLGIVHRDIKPDNLFVTRRADGSRFLKVLDFGISKVQQSTHEDRLTTTSRVMGTPAYMSPEHMRSARQVDHRSDIWALGAVLYELLSGAPPFVAESYGAMVVKVTLDPAPPLSGRLPRGLAEIVYRCLEKDPEHRFQSVAELSRALSPYVRSTVLAPVSDDGPNPWPRRLLLLAGAVGGLGVIVAALIALSRDDGAPVDPSLIRAMTSIDATPDTAMSKSVPPQTADAAGWTKVVVPDAMIHDAPRDAAVKAADAHGAQPRDSKPPPPEPTCVVDLDQDGIPDTRTFNGGGRRCRPRRRRRRSRRTENG